MRMNFLDVVAYLLLILGGIAWALTGLFDYNLFANVFGGTNSALSMTIYTLVGLSSIYALFSFLRQGERAGGKEEERVESVERSSGHELDREGRTHPTERTERITRESYGTTGRRGDRRTNYRSRRR